MWCHGNVLVRVRVLVQCVPSSSLLPSPSPIFFMYAPCAQLSVHTNCLLPPPQRFRDLVSVSGLNNVRPKTLLQHLVACMDASLSASGDQEKNYMTADAFGDALTSIFTIDTLRKQFSAHSDHTVGSALMTVFDAFGTYGGEVCSCVQAFPL